MPIAFPAQPGENRVISRSTEFYQLADALLTPAPLFPVAHANTTPEARAIIHNSDYQSVDECKTAIDKYFKERNEYFQKHPQKAGKKIWGKERVKATFSESNNCKDPKYR